LTSLVLAAGASAGISDPFITVTATNGAGVSSFSIPLVDTTTDPSGTFYTLPAPMVLSNGATVSALFSLVRPQNGAVPSLISLNVTVVAGATDTTFQVNSALFDLVPNIFNAARATAGISLTDNGGAAGVQFNGAGPGGSGFLGTFNGQAPGGTPAAMLFVGAYGTLDPGGSFGANQATVGFPAYIPIAVANDMSSQWHFVVSATDQAAVTSGYFIIPSPGALSLLGLAGLVAIRRSRK
jgi:hypothetical protein